MNRTRAIAPLAFVASALAIACARGNKDDVPAPPPDASLAAPLSAAPVDVSRIKTFAALKGGPLARPLTASGENSDPSFSPDGGRLLFASQRRARHAHRQTYELSLKLGLERRVTFHEGDNASPAYAPDGRRVLYASVTDAIKDETESIRALRLKYSPAQTAGAAAELSKAPAPLPPYDLFVASATGGGIRKITDWPGAEYEARVDARGKRLAFSSDRGNRGTSRTFVYIAPIGSEGAPKAAPTRITEEFGDEGMPSFSPDGSKLAFVRRAPDSPIAHVMIVDLGRGIAKPRALTKAAALNLSPVWHPNGKEIAFASNRADGKSFDLYSVAIDGSCARRLTDAEGDETQPAISPDGTQLAFAGNQNQQAQIYLVPWAPAPGCLPDGP